MAKAIHRKGRNVRNGDQEQEFLVAFRASFISMASLSHFVGERFG
jgi:hypothetical protein